MEQNVSHHSYNDVESQTVAAVAHQSLAKLGRRHTQPYGLRVTRLRQAAAPPKAGFHPVRPVCDDEVGRPAQPVQFLSTSTSRAGEKCNIHHPTHKAARSQLSIFPSLSSIASRYENLYLRDYYSRRQVSANKTIASTTSRQLYFFSRHFTTEV